MTVTTSRTGSPSRAALAALASCAVVALLIALGCEGEGGGAADTGNGAEDDVSFVLDTGDSGGDAEPVVFTRRALLEHLAGVILDTYRAFAGAAADLEAAAAAWAAAPSDEAARTAARDAWIAAMNLWQRAEVFQLGPAALCCDVVGAQDIRDEIYSWPLVNACRVDQETAEGAFADPSAFAQEPPNVRGLDTLEYLLFHDTFENDCAPNSSLNAAGTWAALSEDDIRQARASYASTVAADVRGHADRLLAAWEPDDGNFFGELANAGEATAYDSMQAAFNALSDALFYVEKEVKDIKVAVPAGLSVDCDGETCPQSVESRWARRSLAHVAANLEGFRLLYLGGDPGEVALGLDDYLVAVGEPELSQEIADALEGAIGAAEALGPDLIAALAADLDGVHNLHEALRVLADLLKTQFVSVLDLELPQRAEGDND
jgi:predicted lipoprotein